MSNQYDFDLLVIGSGPAGQKAAIQGAKANKRVAMVEKGMNVGGHCVHHGTIPSKTLRETTVALSSFQQRSGDIFDLKMPANLKMASLMERLDSVVKGHQKYIGNQIGRNGIQQFHGRAKFVSPHEVEIVKIRGENKTVTADLVFIAVGSSPRDPEDIPVDHEHILDSDSILNLLYLPQSMTVLGSGVIASEYASIFAALGVKVTMIDKYELPLGFMDPELTKRFVTSFTRNGGKFLGNTNIKEVYFDGVRVITALENGEEVSAEKLFFAQGRVANLKGLNIQAAGLEPTDRGLIKVDEFCKTDVDNIYAIGDVIGPPSLAASSMEQGRRAAAHALGITPSEGWGLIPAGIYTVPEMSCVGLSEAKAIEKYGACMIGHARFEEIARGHIANIKDGLLKIVADKDGKKILGVHIIGEGATELIHLGQMAIMNDCNVATFVDNIFNFPTLAEAYRVAALDIDEQIIDREKEETETAEVHTAEPLKKSS